MSASYTCEVVRKRGKATSYPSPQLLGRPGSPREWVHVQDKEARHVRNREYILTNRNQLRPVVEIWEPEATPDQNQHPEKERAARKTLQAVFDTLGK